MRWCRNIVILFGGILGLWTCEKPIDLSIPESGERLVVVSSFSNQEEIKLQISKGVSVLDVSGSFENFFRGDARLFENTSFLERLAPGFDSVLKINTFNSQATPKINQPYTITVNIPGFDEVTATSRIPEPIPLSSVIVNDLTIESTYNGAREKVNLSVFVVFEDPPNQLDYYHLKLLQEVWQFDVVDGDTTVVGKSRFEIPFNSSTNNNNVVASFDGGILFDDQLFDGEAEVYILETNIEYALNQNFLGPLFVEFRTLSKDYFLYYTSVSRQLENPDDPLSQPVILYNNIENGLGIFAGYSSVVDSVILF